MQVDLNSQVALVTGAARGIGAAIAHSFAQNGARGFRRHRFGNGAPPRKTRAMMRSRCALVSAESADYLLDGHWRVMPPAPIERLSSLALGLIGLGRIGQRFWRRRSR